MDGHVTFVGSFYIPDYHSWTVAIARMREFVEMHVPRIESFHAYAAADMTEGVVVYVHPDGDSLDQHLAAAADLIREGTDMVSVTSVVLLGSPHPETVDRMRAAGVPVSVRELVTGFRRS